MQWESKETSHLSVSAPVSLYLISSQGPTGCCVQVAHAPWSCLGSIPDYTINCLTGVSWAGRYINDHIVPWVDIKPGDPSAIVSAGGFSQVERGTNLCASLSDGR